MKYYLPTECPFDIHRWYRFLSTRVEKIIIYEKQSCKNKNRKNPIKSKWAKLMCFQVPIEAYTSTSCSTVKFILNDKKINATDFSFIYFLFLVHSIAMVCLYNVSLATARKKKINTK